MREDKMILDPDTRMHVSERLLGKNDGPMLEALKEQGYVTPRGLPYSASTVQPMLGKSAGQNATRAPPGTRLDGSDCDVFPSNGAALQTST
jgi:hypothetical protein